MKLHKFILNSLILIVVPVLVLNYNLNNECYHAKVEEKNVTLPYSYAKQVPIKEFCFQIPFICTKYELQTVWKNKTESVKMTKLEKKCCDGYQNKSGSCLPVCSEKCLQGKCVEPDRCFCERGWTGISCALECDSFHYGENCAEVCACQNEATCDKLNGTCYCATGYSGLFCETKCPNADCDNTCLCENGAICSKEENVCLCQSGYIGEKCENKCADFSFGTDCEQNCTCIRKNTDFCSHISGNCSCFPGLTGFNCEEKCPSGWWGDQCENLCDCDLNSTCDYLTGKCYCPIGWFGMNCSETCPKDRWGLNCSEECVCFNNNNTCDYATGKCICSAGWTGSDCAIPCPEGMFGLDCNFICDCEKNETCDAKNGSCNNFTKLQFALKDDGLFEIIGQVIICCILTVFILCCLFVIYVSNKEKPEAQESVIEDAIHSVTEIENDFNCTDSIKFYSNRLYEEIEIRDRPRSSWNGLSPINEPMPVIPNNDTGSTTARDGNITDEVEPDMMNETMNCSSGKLSQNDDNGGNNPRPDSESYTPGISRERCLYSVTFGTGVERDGNVYYLPTEEDIYDTVGLNSKNLSAEK